MRIVRAFPQRVRYVSADLSGADVEGRRKLDIPDMISPDIRVHQSGHRVIRFRLPIIAQPLNKRAGTISDPDDCDAYLAGRMVRRVHVDSGRVKEVSSLRE